MIMRTLLVALYFHVFISIVSSAPSDEQCQSLLQVSSGSIQCTPHGDCTGLTCFNSITLTNSTFTVDKCQDPVLVNVSVTANGKVHQRVFNQSTSVTVKSHHFYWTMSRNASYLQVMGILREQNANYTLIPSTAVPLNASICMCQSIQSIPHRGQLPFNETNCVNNSQCTGLECTVSLIGSDYTIESDIQPCSHPPGFNLIVKQAGIQKFRHFFNSSTNTTTFSGLPLHVIVIHRPYSMIIGVDAVIYKLVYPLVPRTQIILDKTKCTNKPHPTPSSTQTPPTNTSATGSLATCNAIKQLATNTLFNKCHTNPACDTLDCTTLVYRSKYQILPCSNPPAVHITLYNANKAVIFNHTITNSTTVELPLNFAFVITVHHDKPDAIGLEANLKLNNSAPPINIIPYTEIPIDRCDCANVVCPTPPYPLSPSSTQNPPTNASTPGSLATCNAIKRLATQLSTCHTNPACDTLNCTTLGYRSIYQILPCSNPPAVHVTLYNPNKAVIFNRTITNSTTVRLLLNYQLIITVHHDKPDAIGLEATLKTPGSSTPIIPYTEIPIDRRDCPSVTTTVSVTPTTSSSGSKTIKYAIIGIVVSTTIVILIFVFVIMAIVLMIRKCRRSGQFRFQRLVFNVQDDDDDENDFNKL